MTAAKWGKKKKMCVERCVLSISLIYKAKLKRTLAGYSVGIFIKGKRHWPIRLSNKGGKYLIFSSLNVKLLY